MNADNVRKYIKQFGVERVHTFRKYHASRIFADWFSRVKTESWGKKRAATEFDVMVEKISKKLNNKPLACFKSYIDPNLTLAFFKHFSTPIPEKWKTALKDTEVADKV